MHTKDKSNFQVNNEYATNIQNEKVYEIYSTYLEIIAPFVIQLETLDGEFPVEILNEIRAIFTHLARSATNKNINVCNDNILKAERHVKRAILDCFKYMCVSYDDQYKKFENMYKNVDLSLIDNGEFLPQLCKKRKFAIECIQVARKKEAITEDVEDTFDDFEKAYNAYADVYKLIGDSTEKLQHFKKKATKKEKWRMFLDISGIIGTIFGIIGVILTIVT